MSLLDRLLRRGPSEGLEEAREAHRDVLSRSEEVTEVTTSLRENVRQPNNLAPLIADILRSTR